MKKNLLTLSILLFSIHSIAQDTFIGDKAIVKVENNTLFYNGGSLKLSPSNASGTPLTKVISNDGNIIINNAYLSDLPGDHGNGFINNYLDVKKYGQVIINNNSGTTTGKLTMEKPSVISINNGNATNGNGVQQLPISLPFKGDAPSIMHSFTGKTESNFRGNCVKNNTCSQRYWMTLYRWDNQKIVNDAVEAGDALIPGDYYLLNLVSNTGLHGFYDGESIIGYKGTAAPERYASEITKTVIPNYATNETGFQTEKYSAWKGKRNLYNEIYHTYLGNNSADNNSDSYGKNMFRYGNPFTSNIDLRNPENWLIVEEGIKPFEILKLAQNYKHTWNSTTGSSHNSTGSDQYVRANYNPTATTKWTGSAEAVLIRPLEMFRITFNSSTLLTVGIELENMEKTFLQQISGVSNLSRSENSTEFYQLKVSLVDNENNVITEPVFLSTSSTFETGLPTQNISSATMLLLEEDDDGNTIANAKAIINTFNSEDYIGKPLHLELNNLAAGNQYKLKFNLKENNIFTDDIQNFNGSSFYLYDKVANTYTELNGSSEINIVANENTFDQFTFFWRQIPRTLGVDDLTKKFKTQVYKVSQDQYKVKLNPNKVSASIEIYHVNGSKVGTQSNILANNSSDQLLSLPAGQNGLFIVKVIYNDGTQENIKLLVD